MTWSPDSSITGAAQTGFTDPTYTVVDDTPPAINAKQKTVTALGGTQTGVSASSVSRPFTMTFYKPNAKALPPANALTGLRATPPNNQWRIVFRKGGEAAAGVPVTAIARITIDVPAGMETYNPAEVRGLLSFMIGALLEEAPDLGDSLVTGVA
jgi:hypothetical protein